MGCTKSKVNYHSDHSSSSGSHGSVQSHDIPPVVVEAREQHTATVIFLHGLGDTAEGGWAQQMTILGKHLPHVKFVLPNAPVRHVTMSHGVAVPAWYDIKGMSMEAPEDLHGIQDSAGFVHRLIADEVAAGIPESRIILAGFSQGAALALHAGLTYKSNLGGIIVCSGYLAGRQLLAGKLAKEKAAVPILFCHGKDDRLVKLSFGKMSADIVSKALGAANKVEFKTYDVGHSCCPRELKDIQSFISSALQ